MPFYERGDTRIFYEEAGSGFPLLIIPGGGLNSTISSLDTSCPFNPMKTYSQRLPLHRRRPAERQWGPVHRAAGDRPPLGCLRRGPAGADGPSRHREVRGHRLLHRRADDPQLAPTSPGTASWQRLSCSPADSGLRCRTCSTRTTSQAGGRRCARGDSDVTMEMVHDFLTSMYTNRADFVFTVTRDFVRNLQTPILVAPEDVPAHPYAVAMEVADLAPNSEVTIYPWKDYPGAHRRGGGARPPLPEVPSVPQQRRLRDDCRFSREAAAHHSQMAQGRVSNPPLQC